MHKLLCQLQLSNYDTKGTWLLECDSGYQMVLNRIRELIKLDSELQVDVIGPHLSQIRDSPRVINPDIFSTGRVNYIETKILPNAAATRYDFNFDSLSDSLALFAHKKNEHLRYDAVYVNDPMLLRHYRALFHLKAGYLPKFFVHSHFIDNPECPKFPTEISLWLGQCEAAIKADFNFWQCESAMNVFFDSMSRFFHKKHVDLVRVKSLPWDDGYSIEEITQKPRMDAVRFDIGEFERLTSGKKIIFVPNRIGGMGRSSDYTNCGHFMFDILPKLRKQRDDYVVIAGNPSQKFFNHELVQMCGENGYISVVQDALNRDEYKYIVARSHIAVGLYTEDTYGGTAARECIELGCLPVWTNCNEYKSIADLVGKNSRFLCKEDLSDLVNVICRALDFKDRESAVHAYQNVVRKRCSFESTTTKIYQIMKNVVEN